MDQGVDKDSICQTCGKNELVVIRLVSLLTLDHVILGTFKIEKDVSLFLLSVVVIHG
jgi:hypothetical protein